MKKQLSKLISLILVAALLVQIIPMSVFATESEEIYVEELGDLSADSGEKSLPAQILFEEESLREENVKHFRLDDGSYIAIQYDTPVHYQDENGEWVDYDNTLSSVSTLDGSGVSCYRVENGDSVRVFAADANAEVLLAVRKGDYSLSLTPMDEPDAGLPIDPDQPIVASAMEEVHLMPATVLEISSDGAEEFADPLLAQAQPEKIYSALEYTDVINGADIRYENYANTIKESIVIPEPQAEYTYSFRMETEGLTPSLQEDGSILLQAADASVVYTIPAPYMIDANNEYSYEAEYTLTEAGDAWILTVTADAAWMNVEERAFPVLLDPTVEETAQNSADISAAFVREGFKDAPDKTDTYVYVGDNGNSNQLTRTYLHINELVRLPEGCEIYKAEISLYHQLQSYKVAGSTIEVGAYAITKAGSLNGKSAAASWQSWATDLTWTQTINGTTTIDSILLDKQTLNSATEGDYVTWDITTLAYNWYDSEDNIENLGLALKVVDESNVGVRAAFIGPKNAGTNRPRMKISYRNIRGIEDRYTYQTLNIGRAGTSYLSDYTLENTHIVPLFESQSNVMPFAVSLVYNTSMTGAYFSDYYLDVNTRNYNSMLIGIGWKLSVQQTVTPLTVGGTSYLIYTDGDGTEHYFLRKTDGYYYDEDGLCLKIAVSGTTYTMTNPYGYTWIFTNGYLTEERDAYGNALYYCYNGYAYSSSSTSWKPTASGANKVTAVYRKNVGASTEQLLKIEYNGNYVSKIIGECNFSNATSKADRTVTLGTETWTTDAGTLTMLTSIKFPDNALMQYSYYDSTTPYNMQYRLKTVYDSEANYGIEYSYSYLRNVAQFYEYIMNGNNMVYGAKYHAYKRAHSQTAYRYYGDDGIPYMDAQGNYVSGDSGDDLLSIKVLDHEGRTVGSYTSNGDETEILGAGAATYTENSGTSKKNNRITSTASAGQQGINLLKNSSAEDGTEDWKDATVNTSVHYIGNKSFTVTSSTLYQTATLTSGKTYTFSAYLNVPSATTFSTTGGIKLEVQNSSGITQAESEVVNYSTVNINEGWIRLTVTYTPTSTATRRLAVVPSGVTGSIYVDALQLERSDAASTYNILEDGSFEAASASYGTSSSAFGWYGYTAASPSTDGETLFGNKYVQFASTGTYIRISQNPQLALPGNTSFIFSGWAKANAKPDSGKDGSDTSVPYFGLILRLYYSDGTSEPFYFPYDPYYTDWQYVQGIVEPKRGEDVTITYAIAAAAYDRNINAVSFDNFSLRIEPVYSYDYNDNGDPTSASGTDTGTENGAYTGVDLTTYTAPNGNVTNYVYNDKHDVTQSTTSGVTATNTYDPFGNITNTKTTTTGTSSYINESAKMSGDGNYTVEVTDNANNKTTYDYNSYYGYLNSVTNAKGTKTEYKYTDTNGRPHQTYISGVAAIQYGYNDEGQLSQLMRKTYHEEENVADPIATYQYYNFAYNDWGQNTSISVGNKTLATYEYEDINPAATGGGNLETMTYANGDSVSYEYDEFDRLVKIVYNDTGKVVNRYYSADGALAKVSYGNGSSSDMNYLFEYDSSGRMVRSTQIDNTKLYQRTEHLYDEFDRPYIQRWTIDGKTRSEKYTYDDGASGDGNMTQFKAGSGHRINFNYDELRRLDNASVTNSSGQELFRTEYTYQTVSGDRTSMRVDSRIQSTVQGEFITGYKYTYDALGNITEIRQGTGSNYLLFQYTYDDQNQLIEEVHYDGTGNTASDIKATYTYTYDTAGNIRSETKTVGSTSTTKTYNYDDSQWADLLTSIEVGSTTYNLSYDASGNPLTYRNGVKSYTNLTWAQGRQLTSITTGGKTYNYSYDLDGIRTQKVVDGVTHTYTTLNGKVVRESFPYNGNTIIMDFIYDNLGRPFAVSYSKNGGSSFTNYFYATNAQGDVEGIFRVLLNEDTGLYELNWYGFYHYDAWGNVTVTNANGNTPSATSLIVRNPIRYRGYYYDTETGFYYLQSRYYDPANHRFINADSAENSLYATVMMSEANLFAYCANNPVHRADPEGDSWWGWIAAAAVVVVAAAAVVITAGSVGGAILAVSSVANGFAATTAASTVAANVFIGTATAFAATAAMAATESSTAEEFGEYGDEAFTNTIVGGMFSLLEGMSMVRKHNQPAKCTTKDGGECFVAGTLVKTENGEKAIETVESGDYVWAWDEDSGEIALKRVVETYVNEANELIHIFANGEEIVTTPSHPFYAPVKGWTAACKLRAGDILVTVNGEYVVVEKIQHELLESPVKVYNFQVEDYHTYYVSNVDVLVHNKCKYSETVPSRKDALNRGREFLGDGYTKEGPGRYVSEDLYRQMRFDFSHHDGTTHHINLDTFKNKIIKGERNKIVSNGHIFWE